MSTPRSRIIEGVNSLSISRIISPLLTSSRAKVFLGMVVFFAVRVSAQQFEFPNPTTVAPNIVGAVSKIVPTDSLHFSAEDRFIIGQHGFYRVNPDASPAVAEDLTAQVAFRNEHGYSRGEERFVPSTVVDVVETGAGDFLASDGGVLYSPFNEGRAFQDFMTAGNPELVDNDMQNEKYSAQCGDLVSNPPVNVSALATSSLENVILAASPDGIFRLDLFDYPNRSAALNTSKYPTFCWSRLKELGTRNIQFMHFVGKHMVRKNVENDVWVMTSSAAVYLVEANPRSKNSRISISDITPELRNAAPQDLRPIGSPVRTFYDAGTFTLAVVFDDGVYAYQFDLSNNQQMSDVSTLKSVNRLLQRSDTGLSLPLYQGYYSLAGAVAFSKEAMFVASPTLVTRFDWSDKTIHNISMHPSRDEAFITSIANVRRGASNSIVLGLATGSALEYDFHDVLVPPSIIPLKRNVARLVQLVPGQQMIGDKIPLSGYDYVQTSNPPCLPSVADRQQKEVIDAITSILASVDSANPGPMIFYIAHFAFGAFHKTEVYSSIRMALTGDPGNANCAAMYSQLYIGDLSTKKVTVQVLTYDNADSAPRDDSGRINGTEGGNNCPDNIPPSNVSCDSQVGWARWYKGSGSTLHAEIAEGTQTKPIDVVLWKGTTKDGRVASVVFLIFKNWSHDRVRAGQINLTIN